jgi:hypothetical protein
MCTLQISFKPLFLGEGGGGGVGKYNLLVDVIVNSKEENLRLLSQSAKNPASYKRHIYHVRYRYFYLQTVQYV